MSNSHLDAKAGGKTMRAPEAGQFRPLQGCLIGIRAASREQNMSTTADLQIDVSETCPRLSACLCVSHSNRLCSKTK